MCKAALDDKKNITAYKKMAQAASSNIKGGSLHKMNI